MEIILLHENSHGKQRAYMFDQVVHLGYLLFLPQGYRISPDKKWPLILYLHGMGERGNDLELVKRHGIPQIVERRLDFQFVTVSPQCPADTFWWELHETLKALLDEIIAKYAIDVDCIYLTGNSMGGYGTWSLAIAYPERFAAIAPICGGGFPGMVCVLKNIPVWAFHGAEDEVIKLKESQRMVNALQACGGNVRLTVYPGVGHDSWTQTYNNPGLYEWFLQHSR